MHLKVDVNKGRNVYSAVGDIALADGGGASGCSCSLPIIGPSHLGKVRPIASWPRRTPTRRSACPHHAAARCSFSLIHAHRCLQCNCILFIPALFPHLAAHPICPSTLAPADPGENNNQEVVPPSDRRDLARPNNLTTQRNPRNPALPIPATPSHLGRAPRHACSTRHIRCARRANRQPGPPEPRGFQPKPPTACLGLLRPCLRCCAKQPANCQAPANDRSRGHNTNIL